MLKELIDIAKVILTLVVFFWVTGGIAWKIILTVLCLLSPRLRESVEQKKEMKREKRKQKLDRIVNVLLPIFKVIKTGINNGVYYFAKYIVPIVIIVIIALFAIFGIEGATKIIGTFLGIMIIVPIGILAIIVFLLMLYGLFLFFTSFFFFW